MIEIIVACSLLVSIVTCVMLVTFAVTLRQAISQAVKFAKNIEHTLNAVDDSNSIAYQLKQGSERFHNHETRIETLEAIRFVAEFNDDDYRELIELLKAISRVKTQKDRTRE